MRTIIMAAVVAAAALIGFLFYRGSGSAPPPDALATTSAAPPAPARTNCAVENASYRYNENEALRLSFRRIPADPRQGVELSNDIAGRQIGNMMFIVHVTTFGKDFEFRPVNRPSSGYEYQSFVLYVRPQTGGGGEMPVWLFDSGMHLIRDMPRNDSVAPGYIIMPDLMRRLVSEHIDLPTGAFRFASCERPATQPATAAP